MGYRDLVDSIYTRAILILTWHVKLGKFWYITKLGAGNSGQQYKKKKKKKVDVKRHINAVSQVLAPASWVTMRYCQFWERIYNIMPHRLPEGRRHDKARDQTIQLQVNFFSRHPTGEVLAASSSHGHHWECAK